MGNHTSSGCVSWSLSIGFFSYIWFDKSGTILRRASLSIEGSCVRGSRSPSFGTCLWPAGGTIINLVTGFTFHDEIIHFVFVLDDQIFQSGLNNQGFKMMYQKMSLETPYQSSSLVMVPNSENINLTRCNGIAASKVDPFYQSLSCNQTPQEHFYFPENMYTLEFSVIDSFLTF